MGGVMVCSFLFFSVIYAIILRISSVVLSYSFIFSAEEVQTVDFPASLRPNCAEIARKVCRDPMSLSLDLSSRNFNVNPANFNNLTNLNLTRSDTAPTVIMSKSSTLIPSIFHENSNKVEYDEV